MSRESAASRYSAVTWLGSSLCWLSVLGVSGLHFVGCRKLFVILIVLLFAFLGCGSLCCHVATLPVFLLGGVWFLAMLAPGGDLRFVGVGCVFVVLFAWMDMKPHEYWDEPPALAHDVVHSEYG